MFLGTGDCHIKQTALFFQFPDRHGSQRTREDILLQSYNEDSSKFQTLSRMNGHQGHTRFILGSLTIRIRKQCHILQIIRKKGFIHSTLFPALLDEGRHTAQEFLQVLLSCQVIGISATHDILTDATLLDDSITQFIYIRSMRTLDKRRNEQSEIIQFRQCTLVYIESIMCRLAYHLPETHLVLMRTVSNLHHRCCADTASRIVDDTLDGFLIIRISHQSEIGNNILDFLALIEAQSAIDAIRNALPSELLLEAAALGVGTIQNGEIMIFAIILTLDALDVLSHDYRLFLVAVSRFVLQLLAYRILAIYILLDLIAIILNQTVGCLHDSLRRTVVLLQFEETCTLQLLLIIQDIVNIGTTEAVDTLRIITHSTYPKFLLAQLHHDRHLHMVGVLILIYQDIIEAGCIFLSDFFMFSEQLMGQHQQIIKIHGVGLFATLYISQEYLSHFRHLCTLVLLIDGSITGIGFGTHQIVLSHRYLGMDSSRLV